MDPDFALEGFTVPTILVLEQRRGYRMAVTNMADHGHIYVLSSDDGSSWDASGAKKVLSADQYEGECGDSLRDVAVIYLPDGGYRLLVEGWRNDPGSSVICSAFSENGDEWLPEPGIRYSGAESDEGITSVLDAVYYPELSRYLVYYVGAWFADDGDGIRIAASSDGWTFSPFVDHNVLEQHVVDPFPVLLEGGGIRLYESRLGTARLGAADSSDGRQFEDMGLLNGLADNDCPDPGGSGDGVCRYDPAFVRIDDGRVLLYFGSLETRDGMTYGTLRRAVATDAGW